MQDDPFELWLGRVATDRPLAHRMRAALNRAGAAQRSAARRFTGARIGRGSGVGALLGSPSYRSGGHGRRVVVKARIVRLGGKGLAGAVSHLRYLQRDGTTRDGERGTLYGRDADAVDGKAFLELGEKDRHQFRFIVAPEDGAEYEDLKPLVRRWMKQVEKDLGTRLDWVAVDHFNTGHPHSHVIVRGKDENGQDLVIARNYMSHGLRERAVELVDLDLGPRSPEELLRAAMREVEQERFTSIDRRLLRAVGEFGLVRPVHRDSVEQSLRAGRLQVLGGMGLAREVQRGAWRLADGLEDNLRRMGEQGDIIRTMQRELGKAVPERSPADYAIWKPGEGQGALIGKLVARGLSDEHAGLHYAIVDGLDGRSQYVDLGLALPDASAGSIVRIEPRRVEVREADRAVAAVAAVNGGRYSVDLHLAHDRSATQAFAEAHVRRLESMRRATGSVERQPDGSWVIPRDHLDKALEHERQAARQSPAVLEILSARPLEKLPGHDGATWLDRELTASEPPDLGHGFGADVRRALALRDDAIPVLRQREMRRVAGQLSNEIGLPFAEAAAGHRIEGTYRRAVMVGDSKFAVFENSLEFTLVPWRPVLERARGREISGTMSDGGISWTIGRERKGPEIGF